MTRGLLLPLVLLTLILVGHSPAAPAPKPKPGGAEALLYIKRVPGRTDKEQAKIRQDVRYHLIFGLDQWILKPDTEIPGLKGPFSVPERLKWRSENIQVTWAEDTGVLRITCRAGWPRDQAEFVNNAVKHGIAWYERQKQSVKRGLLVEENIIKGFGSVENQKSKELVEDAKKAMARDQRTLVDLSEIVVLDLAEVPPR
jgi:hypothetical protein